MVKVQFPTQAPRIDMFAVNKDVRAILGEPFKIKIPFTGSPPTEVTVTKDGVPMKIPNDRFSLEIVDGEVVVTDKMAAKEDTGTYAVTLTNEKGSDTVPVNVDVKCPPSKPEGPLEAFDIKAESVTLKWQPPRDTGGSPVTNYVVEKYDPHTGDWVKVTKFARQPEYEVLGLEEGQNYKFRVSAENEFGVSEPLEMSSSVLVKDPARAPGSPGVVDVTDVDEDSISLQWTKPRDDGGKKILGYVVEYKSATDGEWVKAPIGLVKGTQVTVPGLEKGEKYQFRVSAKTEAGIGEASRPTKATECKSKYSQFNVRPRINEILDKADAPGAIKVEGTKRNSISLSWPKPMRDGGSPVTGYVVEKRLKGATDWEQALGSTRAPHQQNSATIDGLTENAEYEFRVFAVNAAGLSDPSAETGGIKVVDTSTKLPEFITSLAACKANKGENAVFAVEVDGKPPPTVKWFRNGVELHPGSKCKINAPRDGPGKATLELFDLDEADAGEITCVLVNGEGQVSSSTRLDITRQLIICEYGFGSRA
ncbi:hypothetical protein Ciccas_008566 [Cichlidogyrus casuarinus]|uniref:Titin n=1 Tax=Cichlidogyrus casuarinus TaxID=1844966 RepID=A0ABD2PZJ0_9PLAT